MCGAEQLLLPSAQLPGKGFWGMKHFQPHGAEQTFLPLSPQHLPLVRNVVMMTG